MVFFCSILLLDPAGRSCWLILLVDPAG